MFHLNILDTEKPDVTLQSSCTPIVTAVLLVALPCSCNYLMSAWPMGPTLSMCVIIVAKDYFNFVTQVHLDIWHFMRRMVRRCVSESHPLFGTFMGSLSSCIFVWDQVDVDQLLSAKRGELINAGVRDPSPAAIQKAITQT